MSMNFVETARTSSCLRLAAVLTTLSASLAAAAGLALINAVANVGSFAGPYMVGWVKDFTGHYALGIMALGLGPLVAAVIAASLRAAARFDQAST